MKIAAPTDNGNIEPHFGHCSEFTIYNITNDKSISGEEKLVPPSGCGCKTNIIPELAKKGVSVVLAGNMGGGAVSMLSQYGIEVYRGLSGDAQEITQDWLAGNVKDSGADCSGSNGHDCHN